MCTHLYQIKNWLELAQESKWHAGKLAISCKVSLRTLERFFGKEFGTTPKAWLAKQRQLLAAERLRQGSWQKETAVDAGYKHATQFSREFKAYWGCTPTEYARQITARK